MSQHKYRRLEHSLLSALVHLVGRIICADRCISIVELKGLLEMEDHFGFDRTLMAESSQWTLATAVARLQEADEELRLEMLESLTALAKADRKVDQREAMLLIALQRCLRKDATDHILTCGSWEGKEDFCGSILYVESATDDQRHQEINTQWELLQLLLQQSGFRLMQAEKMVESIASMDASLVRLLLGYMAPQKTDQQMDDFVVRMESMDSAAFCERILVDTLKLEGCRRTQPCLLFGLGHKDFLQIPLEGPLMDQVRGFLSEYTEIITPSQMSQLNATRGGEFLYDGYSRLFFSLLVMAEPRKSPIVLWPNKSEFDFPAVGLTLRLNQQESTLYTLILIQSLTGEGKGLPLAYGPDQKRLERLYRSIYCHKKLVESSQVVYPDNLAPIRARIEKKMREQLAGLENLEDYIPYNVNHEGFYRVCVAPTMVSAHDGLYDEITLQDEKAMLALFD